MGYQFNPFTGNLDLVGDGGGGGGSGDITAVGAGTGLSGGGTSGAVTLNLANTAVTAGSYTYGSFMVDAQGRITSASSGTAPVTGVTAGTGLSGGGVGGGVTLTLANTAVTAGSYTYGSFTVDAQGRITSASSGTAPVTSVAATGPISSSGGTTPTISISMASNRLLGRTTAETGVAEEISIGTGLSLAGGTLSSTGGGGGGTPGGGEGDIQLNLSSAFGSVTGFKWLSGELQVPGDIRLEDGVGSFTTTIQCVTPTQNNVISYPNQTGTLALVAGSSGQVLYNLNGALAGTGITFDATTGTRFTLPFGYGSGAGGVITQGTNKSTTVVLNSRCGQITMNAANLASSAAVSFTLTNSQIAATDLLVVNHVSGGAVGSYLLSARAGAGSATINVLNVTAGDLAEAVVIAFAVIKATTA